ncbi:response regulator transcription factor [Paraferrimonas haliotis]|uniref:DNA-binding response regulator n=1 Tax=Paraferrimonas haliotis TaxID=2013866 RepID=A0AA37TPD2_9GAMM|nr:response regulator [Paraferrimonas haliotis]GLS82216.1 DNA-binding response regulator [Paraferrimonas haliotis]
MMRLLIVDDDVAFANAMSRRLSRLGFDCAIAHTVSEALLVARRLEPTYVLLDMNLESETGIDLIKPLKSILPITRIVLLTGYASIATAVEAIRRGADDYLAKPADTNQVAKALLGNNADHAVIINELPSVKELEWQHLQQALKSNNGNVSLTARQLGMHRRTLQRKLQKRPL